MTSAIIYPKIIYTPVYGPARLATFTPFWGFVTHFHDENYFQFHRYKLFKIDSQNYHNRDLKVIRNRIRVHLPVTKLYSTILTPIRGEKGEIDLRKQNF